MEHWIIELAELDDLQKFANATATLLTFQFYKYVLVEN